MEMMSTLMYTVNFVSVVLFLTVVLLELLFMIYQASRVVLLIRDCEKRMSENVAITHLAECESDTSYVRKRKMTSFTALSSEPKKGRLCQIPSDKESESKLL